MLHMLEWLPAEGRPEQLLLLWHDAGGGAADMAPLALALRSTFPQAAVLAPEAAGAGKDRVASEWYALMGLTPQNWPGRVDAALPALKAWTEAQQQRLGVPPAATAVAGFGQGAVMALALALQHDGLAGRVLAFAGCLARVPEAAPQRTTLHLFHGADDEVIPVEGSRQALGHLAQLQGDATLDIAQGVGHRLHPALIDCALQRLQTHIPARTWRAALGAALAAAPGAAADETPGTP